MSEDWLSRWQEDRIGWHEPQGNAALRRFWPALTPGCRVLVPLCGKSQDLLWLAGRGLSVVGVELSEIAVRAFFDEAGLPFDVIKADDLLLFSCREPDITMVCGDYYQFSDGPFDAIYDRGSYIAVAPDNRPAYVRHTRSLLRRDATILLITLEYDQASVAGPPFSVLPEEIGSYSNRLSCVFRHNDIDNSPPKFISAGLTEVVEAVWLSE